MENNNLSAVNEGKSPFTVKNVLRVISTLCIIFAFCPAFLVSCSGQEVNVSVMTAVKGVSAYGERIVDPHPVMLICILIPAVILVLLFVKKFTDSKTAAIILICSVCDFVIWLIFRSSVKKYAEENYCKFETKAGFVLNIMALILIILLTALVVLKKLRMDSDFVGLVTGKGATQALNQMSSAGSEAQKEKVSVQDQQEASKVDTSQITNKMKALPKGVYAGAVAIAVLVVIICVAAKSGPTINFDKYVAIEADGYDGYGTARAVIQWNAVEEDYGKKLSYTNKAKKEMGKSIEYIPPIEALKGSVSITLKTSNGLSNGDEVAYTWNVEEGLSDYLKCKVKYKDGTYNVSGLSAVGTFNAFNDLKVSFSGTAPNGSVEWNYNGIQLNNYDFSCDKSYGLRNGDIVTIRIVAREPAYYAQQYGAIPESFEKEYEVSGLEEYVGTYSDLTKEFIATLKSEAEDSIYAYVASSYSSDSSLTDLGYAGYIIDCVKNGDVYSNSYNDVYLIYAGTVSNTRGYFEAKKVYFPVKFRNILKSGSSLTYEQNDGVIGYSTLDNGYSTKGYTNPLTCYMELVEANRDHYAAECGDGFEVYAEHGTINSLDDISDTYKNTLYADAKDKIDSYIADSYDSSNVSTTELSLAGEYLLLAKNQGTDFANNNKYYVVYSTTVSHSKGDFNTTTVYIPMEYNGIVKLPGDEYMTTSSGGILGQSTFEGSWYYTKGYIDGTKMYADLITAKRENYTYEVSEGLKQFGD